MKTKEISFEKFQLFLRLRNDIFADLLAWFSAYYLRFYLLPGAMKDSLSLFCIMSIISVFSTLAVLFSNGLYESHVVAKWDNVLNRLMKASFEEFLLFVVLYYYVFNIKISRLALLLYGLFLFVLLVIGRRISNVRIEKKVREGHFKQKILLVGYGRKIKEYYLSSKKEEIFSRQTIIGQYLAKEKIDGIPSFFSDSLENVVKENDIDVVIIGFPDSGTDEAKEIIRQGLEMLNVKVFILPDIPNSYAGSTISSFHSIPTLQLNSSDFSLGKRFLKRSFDLATCIPAVIVLSPLYLLLAVLVKISSPGPVFFRQKRVTRDGKIFEMLKFRSMRIDMPEQNGPHFTEENDPRITKIGRILRKTSIDEIPQFFNVIGGSMSLIGPRPERPELVEEFKKTIPGYDIRHKAKAGISGWAQVNGFRGNTSIEKRISLDLYYIRNWSLIFDMKIVILTFLKGFINKNAY